MGAHALLSPSAAARWMTCPGAPAMEHGRPDNANEYADEGTAGHHVASTCLDLGTDAIEYLGLMVDVGTDREGNDLAAFSGTEPEMKEVRRSFEVTDKFAADIQSCIDGVRLLTEDCDVILTEQEVPMLGVTGESGACGTADVIAIDIQKQELQVHDHKFGRREVRPDCMQLKMYGLAAIDLFTPKYGPFKWVRLVIHQPRIHEEPQEFLMPAHVLEEARKPIQDAAWSATLAFKYRDNWINKGNSEYLVPAIDACQYCRAAGTCPAQDKAVRKATNIEAFDNFDAIADEVKAIVSAPEPLADIGLKLAAVDLIEAWCDAVRASAYGAAMRGRPVAGWKLVMGRRGNRAWADPGEAETLLKGMRLKHDQMYSYKLASPTAIEKIIGPKSADPVSPKRWAKVKGMVYQAEGKPTLVPAKDTRPEYIPPSAPDASAFDSYEEESAKPVLRAEDML